MRCSGISITLLLAASCCGGGDVRTPPLVRTPKSPENYLVKTPHLPADESAPLQFWIKRPNKERLTRVTRDLVKATRTVISSREFQGFVASYQGAQGASSASDVLDGKDILWSYLGVDAATPPRNPITRDIVILPESRWSVAKTEVTPGLARVFLRLPTIDRAASAVVEEQACAVNTLAHEWTHTIPTASGYGSLYTDKGHKGAAYPLISYQVGSTAQCVYLKQHGYPNLDLAVCVQRVGTTAFNAASCRHGWAASVQAAATPEPLPPTNVFLKLDAVCSSLRVRGEIKATFATEALFRVASPEKTTEEETAERTAKAESLEKYCAGSIGIADLLPGDEEIDTALVGLKTEFCRPQAPFVMGLANTPLKSLCDDGVTAAAYESMALGSVMTPHLALAMKFAKVQNGGTESVKSGTTIETVILSAIVSVISNHAKAELQSYAIEILEEQACTKARRYWFARTCDFLSTDADELPITFGAGLRVALATDLHAVPGRVMTRLPAGVRGPAPQLMSLLFTSSISLLRQQADVSAIANEMIRLSSIVFSCEPNDSACDSTLRAVRFGGEVIRAALHGDGSLTPELERIIVDTAATYFVVLPAGEPHQLLALIRTARKAGEAVQIAPRNDRVDEIGELVDAVVAVVDHMLVLGGSSERVPAGLADLMQGLATGKLLPLLSALVTTFRSVPEIKLALDGPALRMLSFAAELAEATEPDEARAVIESVVAPVGSYRMKRRRMMLSIAAYVGAAAGREQLTSDVLAAGDDGRSRYVAPTAYLGLDLSVPFHNRIIPHGGLMLSIVDLGSLLSYRTSSATVITDTAMEAEVSQVSSVGFAQVFSPGVFARFGVGGSPLVLGAGVAFVPNARQISNASGIDEELGAIRWSLFVAIDVTLLPFHF